jgi:acyl homoserine lactone synthase
MFRNRAEVFSERLNWNVVVDNGYERDRFDEEYPLYLISLDPDSGKYRGSVRLLPTIGPNMLRDVFPFLLAERESIESATIWEASRFCAVASESSEQHRNGLSPAFVELLTGMGEVAILSGWTQIVAVFDERIFRVLKAAGCNPQIIGKPTRIGRTVSFAGLFDVGKSQLQAMREAVGIRGSVLEPRLARRSRANIWLGELEAA